MRADQRPVWGSSATCCISAWTWETASRSEPGLDVSWSGKWCQSLTSSPTRRSGRWNMSLSHLRLFFLEEPLDGAVVQAPLLVDECLLSRRLVSLNPHSTTLPTLTSLTFSGLVSGASAHLPTHWLCRSTFDREKETVFDDQHELRSAEDALDPPL